MKSRATLFKFGWTWLMLCGLALSCVAQQIRTLVPARPVTAGQAFQLQFVLENIQEGTEFRPPDLSAFRIVAGPYTYTGSLASANGKLLHYKNITYTLVAERVGDVKIGEAVIVQQGQETHSSEALVRVLSVAEGKQQQGPKGDTYFLDKGEDPYKKIRENLLLRVSLDKKTCYVGQPLVATFKLYSRLQSRSDVVKNPGFYGFSVMDMVNLDDHEQSTETIDGKLFDVHVIRKAQLYPLQAGTFSIDPMEVVNRVEFSRSRVNKKTEQEIVEGIFGFDKEKEKPEGTDVFETSLHTSEVKVTVKPLPVPSKDGDSVGTAVGEFHFSAKLSTDTLAVGEEGKLQLELTGQGNFLQLYAPAVQWPEGLEGFGPAIYDSLNKSAVPLQGKRVFEYSFVASKEGRQLIPAIALRYFNPASQQWKTDSTLPLTLQIEPGRAAPEVTETAAPRDSHFPWYAGLLLTFLLMAGMLWYYLRKRQRQQNEKRGQASMPQQAVTVRELLQPAREELAVSGPAFYPQLQQAIWRFLEDRVDIRAARKDNETLKRKLAASGLPEKDQRELVQIMSDIETTLFTGVVQTEQAVLVGQTSECLEKIDRQLGTFA